MRAWLFAPPSREAWRHDRGGIDCGAQVRRRINWSTVSARMANIRWQWTLAWPRTRTYPSPCRPLSRSSSISLDHDGAPPDHFDRGPSKGSMLTKGPHGLGKVVPSASRDRERSRRRARSTQAPADAAPDVTSEVGFWTANYAERLRSFSELARVWTVINKDAPGESRGHVEGGGLRPPSEAPTRESAVGEALREMSTDEAGCAENDREPSVAAVADRVVHDRAARNTGRGLAPIPTSRHGPPALLGCFSPCSGYRGYVLTAASMG